MSEPTYRQRTLLRVRIDECDATGTATLGRLLGLFDEARFDLYAALEARGVVIPAQEAVRAERLRIARAPASRETVVVDGHVGRVGNTSFEMVLRMSDAHDALLAELVTTVVALSDGGPTSVDATFRAQASGASELDVAAPSEPDRSVAFLRTIEAWPSFENQGAHVARSRMVDFVVDAYRMGVGREAFEHEGANAKATPRALSVVYDREAFAGDGLRIAIASADARSFDAEISRKDGIVMRARITTTPEV